MQVAETIWSGRRDLNSGPLAPQAIAGEHLAKTPTENTTLNYARSGWKWHGSGSGTGIKVAALFVLPDGPYAAVPGVDLMELLPYPRMPRPLAFIASIKDWFCWVYKGRIEDARMDSATQNGKRKHPEHIGNEQQHG